MLHEPVGYLSQQVIPRVASVNAMIAVGVDKFFEILDTKIHEAKEMLLERYKHIISQDPSSAKFMYENGLMEGYVPEEPAALAHLLAVLRANGLFKSLVHRG